MLVHMRRSNGPLDVGLQDHVVMPNGKGSIECCYCVHWRGEYRGYDGAYEAGFCARHRAPVASTLPKWDHRVWSEFSPNKFFKRDSRISAEERTPACVEWRRGGLLRWVEIDAPRQARPWNRTAPPTQRSTAGFAASIRRPGRHRYIYAAESRVAGEETAAR